MNAVKVYDLNAYLMGKAQMEAFHYGKVAIFQGRRGVIVAECEAVHLIENVITDTVCIPCNKPAPEGKVCIIASNEANIPIKDILAEAPYEEMPAESFFSKRTYNIRCEQNWTLLLKDLESIDYDVSGLLE